MSIAGIFRIAIALVPAIALCVYVYKKDRADKEPLLLLLGLFALGVLSCFPAGWLERILESLRITIFEPFSTVSGGKHYLKPVAYYAYHAFGNFIGVAMVEEGVKWLVLIIVTSKSKHFNGLFDGIIYAVFVSLGFAAFENILYVINSEMAIRTAIVRMLTAVPAHMFLGVIMGYFYSQWKILKIAGELERMLCDRGVIKTAPSITCGTALARSIILPILLHGLYDFTCSFDTLIANVVFYVFLFGLYVFAFTTVQNYSIGDCHNGMAALGVVMDMYPEVCEELSENAMSLE